MRVHRLSAAKIRHAKPGKLLADGGGLMLQTTIGKDGRKNQSWLFRYALPEKIVSRNGKARQRTRDMGIGPLATVSLHEARERAKQLRQLRLDEVDPIEHRKAQRAQAHQQQARVKTFEECALGYVAAHGIGWRSQKHAAQWLASLRRLAFPVIGKLPVSQVDTPLLLKILQPIWTEKVETANRLRGRIEAVLNWATAGGYRTGDNPAEWNHLKFLLPAVEKISGGDRHLESIPYTAIAAFLVELRKLETSAAGALEFTALTAGRTNEILGAKWDEISKDPETGVDVWAVPPSRTKSGRLHRVPLSSAALAVIQRQRAIRRDDFIFPGRVDGRGLGHNAMLQVLAALGRRATVHGLRASFRTWAAERTSFPRELCEVALGHVVGDETERAYQRGPILEKRARLMQQWADYVNSPLTGEKADKVVQLTRGR